MGATVTSALCLLAFVGTLILALPRVLAEWPMTPDAVEYVAIAYNWATGHGFVDPVVFSYYLRDADPPVPGLAVRAPLVSVILAPPFALGSGLRSVLVMHAVFAGAVGSAAVAYAARLGSRASAAAFCVGFCWCYAWILAVQVPLTEAVAVGAVVLLAALSRPASRSLGCSALFGAAVFLAWLARPNLALALAALALAVASRAGLRAAVRSAPLWLAIAVFAALQQVTARVLEATTGLSPYEHYGVVLQMLVDEDLRRWRVDYAGWLPYLVAHIREISLLVAWHATETARLLFLAPDFHYVGWFAAPALIDAWQRRDRHGPERLFLAFLGLALLAVAILSWSMHDPRRYALPAVACLWLLAATFLADVVFRLAARWSPRDRSGELGRGWGLVPGLVLAVIFSTSPSAAAQLRLSRQFWQEFQMHGAETGLERLPLRSLCPFMERDALVASASPWDTFLLCGNAGWVLPSDVDDIAWLQRYLDEVAPAYLVSSSDQAAKWRGSKRIERLASSGGQVLFRVERAGRPQRRWQGPPPLAGRRPTAPERDAGVR